MKNVAAIIVGFMCLTLALNAQYKSTAKNVKDSIISVASIEVSYAFQLPGGDLAKRYNANSNLGGGFTYKTSKNWLWGINGQFIFGSSIKEDSLLSHISTSAGAIITAGGTYGEVYTYERGYVLGATIGKLIPLGKTNRNTGLMISLGGGFINHKIRIEVGNNNVYPLMDDYKKGYDRKTNGPCATGFIGYRYMGNKKLVNFYAGFDFLLGFTKERRPWNFDQAAPPSQALRNDMLYGIRVGWMLPLYRRDTNVYYYN